MNLKKLGSWIIPITIGISLAFAIKAFLMQPVTVSGTSMIPNLVDKERMFAIKPLQIKRFSVVVFNAHDVVSGESNNSDFVKRVIGLPGDTIKYTATGKLYINGKYQNQNFISNSERIQGTTQDFNYHGFSLRSAADKYHWDNKWSYKFTNSESITVPANCYFVLGDHRSVSFDSRRWGFVPKSKMIGVTKVLPWHKHASVINNYQN